MHFYIKFFKILSATLPIVFYLSAYLNTSTWYMCMCTTSFLHSWSSFACCCLDIFKSKYDRSESLGDFFNTSCITINISNALWLTQQTACHKIWRIACEIQTVKTPTSSSVHKPASCKELHHLMGTLGMLTGRVYWTCWVSWFGGDGTFTVSVKRVNITTAEKSCFFHHKIFFYLFKLAQLKKHDCPWNPSPPSLQPLIFWRH